MTTVINEPVVDGDDRGGSAISWGAIFAGLVVVVATGGLSGLLGSAIGISIADATDLESMGEGFGIGAAIWVILSFGIAYFVGGLLAGRLSGNADNNVGMLHGVTLWGLASLLSIWLGFAGITSVAQTGASAITGVATSAAEVGSAAASGGEGIVSAVEGFADSALFDRVTAIVKRSATANLAEGMAGQSSEVSRGEARAAINDIDPEVLKTVGGQLLDGDVEGARDALANQTALSATEIDALVNSASESIKSEIPGSSSDESAVEAAGDYLSQQLSETIASADSAGGADVDSSDVRSAMEDIEVETMQRVGMALISGETGRAQDILATNTSLSDSQIEAIVAGAEKAAEQQIAEFKQSAEEAAETASTYAAGLAWALFAASALALVVCIIGGRLGADTVRRLYAIRQTRTA